MFFFLSKHEKTLIIFHSLPVILFDRGTLCVSVLTYLLACMHAFVAFFNDVLMNQALQKSNMFKGLCYPFAAITHNTSSNPLKKKKKTRTHTHTIVEKHCV